jgi:hypothetical protein
MIEEHKEKQETKNMVRFDNRDIRIRPTNTYSESNIDSYINSSISVKRKHV